MTKLKKSTTGFILILCFFILCMAAVWGQTDILSNPQQDLANISIEERTILDELFMLSQEIDDMNRAAERLQQESLEAQKNIFIMEVAISKRQDDYDSQLAVLEQVLVAYQKNGPASNLEILLSAENLSDFIKRLNVLRDLSHNTAEILQTLNEEKNNLVSEREDLISNKSLMENKLMELEISLAQKLELRQQQQDILNSLSDKKQHYEDRLDKLEHSWNEVKELFSDVSSEFTRVIYESNLSLQDFNLILDFMSVKGSVSEDLINEIIEKDSKLPRLVFKFNPKNVQIEVPDYELLLHGAIAIESTSILKFEVTEGTFYGMQLEPYSIEELFKEGDLLLDFSAIVSNITLKSVNTSDGYIEFTVNPFF